jgi:hypothetical protein
MKFWTFSIFWVIFALLDPDPDPATQINADPDPKPWNDVYVPSKIYKQNGTVNTKFFERC